MAKNKQIKFTELDTFENVLQYKPDIHEHKLEELKGKWGSAYFKNGNPITLELACGKGDYTLGLARKFPDQNFVGIDVKGDRIWKGAKMALEEKLENVGFVRIQIEALTRIFGEEEIKEIWITFPDPFPKKGKSKKRLTSPRFLDIYRRILVPKGSIHLKTDEDGLYAFSLEILEEQKATILENITDIDAQGERPELLQIQTFYEKQHLEAGRTIKYLRFHL